MTLVVEDTDFTTRVFGVDIIFLCGDSQSSLKEVFCDYDNIVWWIDETEVWTKAVVVNVFNYQ